MKTLTMPWIMRIRVSWARSCMEVFCSLVMLPDSLYSFSMANTSWLVRSPCSSPSTLKLKVPSLACV